MSIEPTGTLSYYGVEFDALTRTKITSRPVADEAGRTTIYVEHTLEVEGYLSGGTDEDMTEKRKKLTANGQALEYTGKGFGDLVVNSGAVKDAKWGPWPELLQWDPIGSNEACLIHWRVVVRIPECDDAHYEKQIMAVNYEQSWDIDNQGLTSMTTSGYLEIPMTFSTRNLTDIADAYRDQIATDAPIGFTRSQKFHLSKDKRRLDWSFTDKEMPYPLPDGVTAASIEHTIGSEPRMGFNKWNGTISASITMAPGQNKASAWDKFMLILRDRISFTKKMVVKVKNATVFPTSIQIREDVLNLTTHFSVGYWISGLTLETILNDSGLWRPIPGTDFQKWKGSLADSTMNIRGAAGLYALPSDDYIIDLCTSAKPKQRNILDKDPQNEAAQKGQPKPIPGGGKDPDPKQTWIYYINSVEVWKDDKVAQHSPLNIKGGKNPIPSKLQQVVEPIWRIRLSGWALRTNFRIPTPELTMFGGQVPQETYRYVNETQPAAFGGIPIFYTAWILEYVTAGAGQDIPICDNPALGIEAVGTGLGAQAGIAAATGAAQAILDLT